MLLPAAISEANYLGLCESARSSLSVGGGLGELRVMRRVSWVMHHQDRVRVTPAHPARLLKRQRLGEHRLSEGQIFVTFTCQDTGERRAALVLVHHAVGASNLPYRLYPLHIKDVNVSAAIKAWSIFSTTLSANWETSKVYGQWPSVRSCATFIASAVIAKVRRSQCSGI